MKIKLAILEENQNYLDRLVSSLSSRYAEELEVYAFTETEAALSVLDKIRIDVFVVGDGCEIDGSLVPPKCGFAYFTDSPDIETIRGQTAIGRFQKIDLIYKSILNIYSEHFGQISGLKYGDNSTFVISFQPVSGGSGSSTMAAACAVRFASRGKKVLYVDLETFGTADTFFSANGQFDMSDIIYAIKSRRSNLAMKFESCAKRDETGVYFYSGTKSALDMMEMTPEDLLTLVSEVKAIGSYDYMILDMDFSLSPKTRELYDQIHSMVWVGDGTATSNEKLRRAVDAAVTLEENQSGLLVNKLHLAYNRFSKRNGHIIETAIKSIGGIPRIDGADNRQIIERAAEMDIFDKLM